LSRDRTVGDTFFIAFTTRAFATGIPTVLAGTPVVSAYEDAGLTQITAGITLGVDHDSVVGLNMLTLVATGANGYESGKDYNLVITTGTVGGVSVVGEVVGQFSLGLSAAAVDLANGTDGLGAIKTDTAAILVDTADIQPKIGTPAADLSADIAAVKVDTAATLVDTADMQPKLGTPASDISADIAAVKVDTAATLVDTADMQPKLGTPAADISADIAAVKVDTAATLVDTADMQPKLGTPAADISADIAAVKVDTAAILVDTDTTIPALIANLEADSIAKNAAYSNFEFLMVLTSDHVTPATGLTVTGERSIDGGAFSAVSGTIAEVSNGIYQFDALAADTNGDVITWRFLSATADDTFVTFNTST